MNRKLSANDEKVHESPGGEAHKPYLRKTEDGLVPEGVRRKTRKRYKP